jgi:hypothetical protein
MLITVTKIEDDLGAYYAVFSDESPVAILCRREHDEPFTHNEWVPMFGVNMKSHKRIEIPSCFSLREDFISALDDYYGL